MSNDKNEIIRLLKQIDFLTVDETTCQINFSEDFCMFSLLNIPPSYNKKADLLQVLKLDDSNRLYKKNFFVWYLVPSNFKLKEEMTNSLKNVQFGEEKLKFDCYNHAMIKKNVIKRIHNIQSTLNYQRETSELKSGGNNQCNLSVSTSSETGSWRKKSTDCEDLAFKGKKNDQNSNSTFKRKRFNSDGDENVPRYQADNLSHTFVKKVESNLIAHRYSHKQMYEFYRQNLNNFGSVPIFNNFVEDICCTEKREKLCCEKSKIRLPGALEKGQIEDV